MGKIVGVIGGSEREDNGAGSEVGVDGDAVTGVDGGGGDAALSGIGDAPPVAPRGRGRSRKDKGTGDGTDDTIRAAEPSIGGGSGDYSGGTRANTGSGANGKRGRKSQKARGLGLGSQIQGAHKLLGLLPGVPSDLVEISDQEAEALGEAVQDVLSHYDMTVNPVWAAWINLAAIVGVIYGPKIVMLQKMSASQKLQKQPVSREASRIDQTPTAVAWPIAEPETYGPMM